jgi:hypothetical protein
VVCLKKSFNLGLHCVVLLMILISISTQYLIGSPVVTLHTRRVNIQDIYGLPIECISVLFWFSEEILFSHTVLTDMFFL